MRVISWIFAASFCMPLALVSPANAQAQIAIDPATTDLPWMNGPARDAYYRLSSAVNHDKVHVFEAFSESCSWCNANAAQVQAMAQDYVAHTRVAFVDLGIDEDDRDFQRWIAVQSPTYPVVKDVDRKVYQALMRDSGVPQTFVVDCRGNLSGATVGYWGEEEKAALAAAIAGAEAVTCE